MTLTTEALRIALCADTLPTAPNSQAPPRVKQGRGQGEGEGTGE